MRHSFSGRSVCHFASAHDTKNQGTPEKHVNIYSVSLTALRALRAVRTMSPWFRQCQEALNDISALDAVGLYWIPRYVMVRGNENADVLSRNVSTSGFVGLEPALGISQQDLRKKISWWMGNQHRLRWHNLGNSQRQSRELISGPCWGTRVTFCPLLGLNPG
jgi:hypothetical protein